MREIDWNHLNMGGIQNIQILEYIRKYHEHILVPQAVAPLEKRLDGIKETMARNSKIAAKNQNTFIEVTERIEERSAFADQEILKRLDEQGEEIEELRIIVETRGHTISNLIRGVECGKKDIEALELALGKEGRVGVLEKMAHNHNIESPNIYERIVELEKRLEELTEKQKINHKINSQLRQKLKERIEALERASHAHGVHHPCAMMERLDHRVTDIEANEWIKENPPSKEKSETKKQLEELDEKINDNQSQEDIRFQESVEREEELKKRIEALERLDELEGAQFTVGEDTILERIDELEERIDTQRCVIGRNRQDGSMRAYGAEMKAKRQQEEIGELRKRIEALERKTPNHHHFCSGCEVYTSGPRYHDESGEYSPEPPPPDERPAAKPARPDLYPSHRPKQEQRLTCGPETKPGDSVVFIGSTKDQVNWGGNDDPAELLTEGKTYVVADVEVRSSHTKLRLTIAPDKKYNSVSFRPAAEQDQRLSEEDQPECRCGQCDDCVDELDGQEQRLEPKLCAEASQAIGWTWAEACCQLDAGKDPRKYEMPKLIARAARDLGVEEPANPPECLCDARRREEEAGMVYLDDHGKWVITEGIDQVQVEHDTCIHCKLPIKRSLKEG